MRVRSLRISLAFVTATLLVFPSSGHAASLELYGTFHAMGIIVTIDPNDDADRNSVANVEYRVSWGGAPYSQGFPLTRVNDTRFVGSLFWLEPGTEYDVRVTFSDPGGPLDGATVDSSASTRAEISIPAPSRSYFVSPTGSGTVCSLASPCSLTEGLNRAGPGEEVVLRGGIYYQGEISLPHSGTAGAPIIIRGYEGETAVLDGGDPATFTWAAQGDGTYHTTVHVGDPHLVLVDGERLFPYPSLSDLRQLPWDIPGFYANGTDVYVHLAGDADPNEATMVVSRYNYSMHVAQDYIYFLDLTFRQYGQGDAAKAIRFENASDNLVQSCTFAVNSEGGVHLKGESHRNVIQDSEFYDTVFMWPWDAAKDDGNLESGGIRFSSQVPGRGNIIRRNVFHGFFDAFSPLPSNMAGITNETDIYENLIYNIGDDGVGTDGLASNVRIWGNTIHDVLVGISLAPVYPGPVYAIRNLIYRIGAGNSRFEGNSFKLGNTDGPSGSIYLFHNTVDGVLPGTPGVRFSSTGSWTVIARNNIWMGARYALHNRSPDQPISLDYDDVWNGDSDDALVRWNSVSYDTLPAFTAATGQEPQGLSTAPGFADAETGNYTLDSASDLIDAGLPIPGINDDYAEDGPDIGAFEYTTPPTGVKLVAFEATGQGDAIRVTWLTATEVDTLGFNLYRAELADGPLTQLNETLIPSQLPGSPLGAIYKYLDRTIEMGVTYYYWLEQVDLDGTATWYGPVSAAGRPGLAYRQFLPLVRLK